jgi:NB-ARC domain
MIIWTVRRRNSPLDAQVQQVPQQVDARREAGVTESAIETGGGDSHIAGRDLITTNTTTMQIVGAPTDPLPRPELLPGDVKDFIGRENEIIRLTSLAASEASKVAVICGAPGIGKTSLARRAAHQLRDEADFPGGYLYEDMLGYTTRRTPLAPGEVLGRFLRRLGVTAAEMPAETEERAGLFRQLLESRRALVVLDNVRAESQVELLLPGAGQSVVFITSRSKHVSRHSQSRTSPRVERTGLACLAGISNHIRHSPAAPSRRSCSASVNGQFWK